MFAPASAILDVRAQIERANVTAMKKLLFVAGALAISAPLAFAGGKTKAHVAKISMAKARAIALAKIPGTVRSGEFEHERGRWIYSFEIKPTGETRKIIREVNVDADSGTIVSLEVERDRAR